MGLISNLILVEHIDLQLYFSSLQKVEKARFVLTLKFN